MSEQPLIPVLELAMSQLDLALENASGEVERLSGSIASITALATILRSHGDPAVDKLGVKLADEAARAVFAMQFHDQLVQRLTHVRDCLGEVGESLGDPCVNWPNLLERIRSHYTTEDERRLFDAMLGDQLRSTHTPADSDHESLRGSVELF